MEFNRALPEVGKRGVFARAVPTFHLRVLRDKRIARNCLAAANVRQLKEKDKVAVYPSALVSAC